mmetsp:Transcript_15767/g.61526  ORF Transcript_15767/g.61526 Transcript_15767/m.61526 type:complete len:450 (-) Transcript_15767:3282-4631(-)
MGKGGNASMVKNHSPTREANRCRKVTQIRGQVYDITDFAESHPGGAQLLALAVGRDATILFESHHIRTEIVDSVLKTLPKVDDIDKLFPDEDFPAPLDSPVYRKIQQRVRDEILAPLERTKGRAATGRGGCLLDMAAVVAFFFTSLSFYIACPSIATGIILGLAGYWSGTGLQHTANHGGLCRSSSWNQFWGWFGSDVVIGKSSLEWRYHHTVSHHSYCNDINRDQDVYTSFPLIRLDETQPWSWYHTFQPIYTPFIWPLLYLAAQIGDFVNIFIYRASPGVEYTGITPIEVALYVFGKIFHVGITLAIPVYLHGWAKIWAPFVVYGCFGSFVLCWFFIVSHNLDGLRPQQFSHTTRNDWGRWQIETSASWGNVFWSFLSGGLNYQIEHHLFPGVAHNLYPLMQPIIKQECVNEGIQYNGFDGYLGIVPITFKMFCFLTKMSLNPSKTK